MKILGVERYNAIKKATQEKIMIDRPINDIAKEFGVSSGWVSKIKHSKNFLDFKSRGFRSYLSKYGISDKRIDEFLSIAQDTLNETNGGNNDKTTPDDAAGGNLRDRGKRQES